LAKEKLTADEVKNKLLLGTGRDGRTVFHNAANLGKLILLQKIMEWAKENLTLEEIKNKLLLAIDYMGWNILHVAAKQGNVAVLHILREWATERLTAEEINKIYFLPESTVDGPSGTWQHYVGDMISYSGLKRNKQQRK